MAVLTTLLDGVGTLLHGRELSDFTVAVAFTVAIVTLAACALVFLTT
jgi:hypothetical protein